MSEEEKEKSALSEIAIFINYVEKLANPYEPNYEQFMTQAANQFIGRCTAKFPQLSKSIDSEQKEQES